MSEKRRDNKGRVLRTGEGQRSNGQYYYKYTDANKEPKHTLNDRGEKMSVNIGDNNNIKNTTIGEHVTINNPEKKERFNEKHPFITGVAISVIAGFILLFSFWSQIVQLIEEWF